METLQRMNAHTTEELTKYVAEYSRIVTFKKFFDSDYVDRYFDGMLRYQSTETMDAFAQYHSENHIKHLFEIIFPCPDIYDLWNAWDRKGRPHMH